MTAVLHVINGLETGGAERVLVQLAATLHTRGLAQHIVSLGHRGLLADDVEAKGIAVTALGMKSVYDGLWGVLRLARIIKQLQPDVVQGWMYHGNSMAALAARLSGGRTSRRLFWNLRASNMDDERYGRVIRWSALASRWPDVVIANSQAGANFHLAHGYRPRRIEVISNGVDTEKFRPRPELRAGLRSELGIPSDAVVAIHVARTDRMKDHATFLSAMAAVPDVRGLLVGLGTDRLTLPPNVRALGLRSDVERLYASADLVVSSSAFGEGFSNVLAEGMSAGLVPLATDVGDARALVGDTGTILRPRDPAGLAAALAVQAGLSSEERRSQGVRARDRMCGSYQLARATDAFERLYTST